MNSAYTRVDGAEVDPSWGATESGHATNIDLNTKCDEEIDTANMPVYGRDSGMAPPPGDKGVGRDEYFDNMEDQRAKETLYE